MARATPEQACRHPTWSMGRKISVDSASLMNKGLEVIEAHHLFGLSSDRIHVLVHPESIIHGLVQFEDGSVLAQMGAPDMRTPLASCLFWPERLDSGVAALDLASVSALHFEAPDSKRFPCLDLARQALASGGTAPTLLNAANESAVQLFLDGRIEFPEIAVLIARTLDSLEIVPADSLDVVFDADARARQKVAGWAGSAT